MPNPNVAKMHLKALESPNHGKRGQSKKTLMKQAARDEAIKHMAEMYKGQLIKNLPEITEIQMTEAKKPEKTAERIYVLDRGLGKADEPAQKHLHLHKHEGGELNEAARKLIEEYEAKLRELKTK